MGSFWIIWLFGLIIFKKEASALENLHLNKMYLKQIPLENNVAKCLTSIIDEIVDDWITKNILINIEANSPIIKQDFLNTVVELMARNKRSTFGIVSDEKQVVEFYFRMYFIESLKLFEYTLRERRNRTFPKNQYLFILIILPKEIANLWLVLESIFEIFWNLSITNVDVLIEDQNGSVTLYTYYPFKEQRCRDSSPQVINRYTNGSFMFKTPHFPNKINDFGNCPINVIALEYPPYSYLVNRSMNGFDGIFFKQLANVLNFSISLIHSPIGLVFENQTFTGGFKMLNDGTADLMIGDCICTGKRMRFFAASHYNTYYKHIIFQTDVAASSLKTLVLPFDLCTWLIIFGLSIYKKCLTWPLQKNIFKRKKGLYNWYIIAPYMASFLIIRSLYEASTFKIFHNRPIVVRPNNLDEAIQQGYTFMGSPDSYAFHIKIPELKNHITLFNSSDLLETFFQTQGKYAFLASKAHMAYYSKGRQFFMAPTALLPALTCMYMPKQSYMADAINKRIVQLRTHGHMQKIDTLFSNINAVSKSQSNEPQAYFSIKHLMGAFDLYFILISLSSFVFALEVISKRNRRLKAVLGVFDKSMRI